MKFMRPDKPPIMMPPTAPATTPAPMPVMPVVAPPRPMPVQEPVGIGGTAPIMPPPIMPPSDPGPRPMPPMPMPTRPGGTLKKLMFERDRLQARLDQINARIQELMQGQGSRKPQEGIESLLEVIMRPEPTGRFGD